MTTELATRPDSSIVASLWNREQVDTIKAVLVPGATDQDLMLLAQVSQRTGLDLFTRQMYGIMRKSREEIDGKWVYVKKLSIQISIDGFRLIAARTGEYTGQEGPFWCGPDGKWTDVWLSKEPPAAAKVGVWRKGFQAPLFRVATFNSYAETKQDGTLTKMWAKMPEVLIAKCAESLALRTAFPQELGGLYTADEMGQADNVVSAPMLEATQPADVVPQKVWERYGELFNQATALGIDVSAYDIDRNSPKALVAAQGKALASTINDWQTPGSTAPELPPVASDTIDQADLNMIAAARV